MNGPNWWILHGMSRHGGNFGVCLGKLEIMYRRLYNEFHIIINISDYSSLAGIIHFMHGTCRITDTCTKIWMAVCVSKHQDIYDGFRRLFIKYCMKLLNIYCFTSHVFSLCIGKGGVRKFLDECVIWREFCGEGVFCIRVHFFPVNH